MICNVKANPHTELCRALLIVAAATLLAGCAETVTPEEFLYTYRRGSGSDYNAEGFRAGYSGRSHGYHYLEVRREVPEGDDASMLLYGGFRDETLRCPAESLPEGFPGNFQTLAELEMMGYPSEPPAETRQYVRKYLAGQTEGAGGGFNSWGTDDLDQEIRRHWGP